MESEKPTGPATQDRSSSGYGAQGDYVTCTVATRPADEKLPEVADVEMDAEDSCEAKDDHVSGCTRAGSP